MQTNSFRLTRLILLYSLPIINGIVIESKFHISLCCRIELFIFLVRLVTIILFENRPRAVVKCSHFNGAGRVSMLRNGRKVARNCQGRAGLRILLRPHSLFIEVESFQYRCYITDVTRMHGAFIYACSRAFPRVTAAYIPSCGGKEFDEAGYSSGQCAVTVPTLKTAMGRIASQAAAVRSLRFLK